MTIVRSWIVPQIEPRTGLPSNPPLISTTSLPNATQGTAYSFQMSAINGVPPYSWSIASEGDPAFSISSSGLLTGTTFNAETTYINIQVTDSLNTPTAPTNFQLIVNAGATGPGAPSKVWPGNVGLTSVALAWQGPTTGPTPSSYNLYRNGTKVYSNVLPDSMASGLPWIEDQNLTPNTQYTYFPTSNLATGESAPGPSFTATTLANGPAAAPNPVAPLTWIAPFSLPTGTVWTCTNTSSAAISGTGALGNVGCSLNWAINGNGTTNTGYAPGDLIVLTAGQQYNTGTALFGYGFPNKANPNNLWTYVISSETPGYTGGGQTLPAASFNTQLGGGVTDYNGTGGNWVGPANSAAMAEIVVQVANGVGVNPAAAANFIRFVGIWIHAPTGGSGPFPLSAAPAQGATSITFPAWTGSTQNFVVIVFSNNDSRTINLVPGQTSASFSPALGAAETATANYQFTNWSNAYCVQMPFSPGDGVPITPCESVYFDRCMFGLDPNNLYAVSNSYTFQCQGVWVYGNHVLISQCYFQGFSDAFGGTAGVPTRESHAIEIMGGSNICIQNCHLDAVSECVFQGGGAVLIDTHPSDLTVRHNFLLKNPKWFPLGGSGDFKNFMECKCGIRINVHHNVATGNANGLVSAQNARCFIYWVDPGNNSTPGLQCIDVDFHDNVVNNSGGMIYFSGAGGGTNPGLGGFPWAPCARMRSFNNILLLNPPATWAATTHGATTSPLCIQLGYNVPDTIYDHNTTVINLANTTITAFSAGVYANFTVGNGIEHAPSDGTMPNGRQLYSDRCTVTNNILSGTTSAFWGSSLSAGSLAGFNTLFPSNASASVHNNLYINDKTVYTGDDFPGVAFGGVGFANWTDNTTLPAPNVIANCNVTTTAHATGSTTGGPIGAIIGLLGLWNDPLPDASLGVPYFYQLTGAGGIPPYTFSIASGTLPAGLTLSSSGVISGTPTVTQSLDAVTFTITDSSAP